MQEQKQQDDEGQACSSSPTTERSRRSAAPSPEPRRADVVTHTGPWIVVPRDSPDEGAVPAPRRRLNRWRAHESSAMYTPGMALFGGTMVSHRELLARLGHVRSAVDGTVEWTEKCGGGDGKDGGEIEREDEEGSEG
jgi:hypothetical protein